MDCSEIWKTLKKFIEDKVKEAGVSGVVIGVSGGVDSAVTLVLCVKALGPDKVLAMILPTLNSNKEDTEDATKLVRDLGVEYHIVDLTPDLAMFELFYRIRRNLPTHVELSKVAIGNLIARLRMVSLYYFANLENLLVVGTSNKTERMLGYFTKYGDGASDIIPLGGLYKTQVRELAKFFGIPNKIITKAPTAGLWQGQTDEGEIGASYEDMDTVLMAYEKIQEPVEVCQMIDGVDMGTITMLIERVNRNSHKLKMPEYPNLNWW